MAITSTETQVTSSYTIEFYAESNTYPLSTYPEAYLTIDIYDENDDLYHSVTNLTPEQVYAYTFNSNDVGNYTVVYKVYSGDPLDLPDESSAISFEVLEYQPTFILPTVTCAEMNKPFSFFPLNLFLNNNDLCPINPINNGDYEIEYKRYEFNINNSTYELKDTETLTIDPLDITNENDEGEITDPEIYAYQGGAWVPNKLAMVKFIVTVNNCSALIEKATVFPICGSWKIRRLACGNYRIYNYKNSNIAYSLYKGVDPTTLLKTEVIPAFSYVEVNLTEDNIYRVVADGITQYIFNYCDIEECMLNLHKRILLDENLCDECKLDKVLYQKALRLLPTYEVWKKLLDKDWVYDMQYKSSDISGELARLYDAQELYLELIKLCDECKTSKNNCGCGC
jgi:hypothetical protein